MSLFSQCRLIDILSSVDISLLEAEFPEQDSYDGFPEAAQQERREIVAARGIEEAERHKKRRNKKIAVLSGLAAGSIAVTGVVVFVLKKHDLLRKAA